jgi:hypothetical protein
MYTMLFHWNLIITDKNVLIKSFKALRTDINV